MLKALISYFPEKESQTGVGALEYPAEERKKLALQSRKWVCPVCGPIVNLVKEKEEEKQPDGSESKLKAEEKKVQEDEEVSVAVAEAKNAEEPQEEEHKLNEVVEEPQSSTSQPDFEISMEKSGDEKRSKNYQKGSKQIIREQNALELDLQTLESGNHIIKY